MITFTVFYVVCVILYYFINKGTNKVTDNLNGFANVICMFIPIINFLLIIANLDWVKICNNFFKLK